ncbi:MAG: hypothetical protein IT239_01690 [Bacteroidia bacterium]|nr:hypothetical protein [Bacteroidia bacterium]
MRFILTKVIIITSIAFAIPVFSHAQIKGATPEEKQKNADKKKEELKQEELEATERGKARHEKIQTKETRKRMKKSRKKADKTNANKRPSFFDRLTTHYRGKKK